MIVPYFGEFLISPIPIELSLNYCSHGCAFCFANLNQPDRTAHMQRITNLLRDYRSRDTLEARLLSAGYPVLLSNKSDPFAHSNFQQPLPLLRTMTALEIPVSLQTRGGLGVDEALSFLSPSVWYISINTASEDFRRQLEPGAPTLESRFRLMETLSEKGHRVVLGLNPLVPEWVPDPTPILTRAKACGAEGVWIEVLHFNPKQVQNLSVKERKVLTEDIIARSRKRHCPAVCSQVLERARATALDLSLSIFSMGQPFASDFFTPWREMYRKTFPVLQDLVNWCVAEQPETLTFDELAARFVPGLPQGKLPLTHYIGAVAHNVLRTHRVPSLMTYRQLLSVVWQDPRIKFSPARMSCFAYAAEREGDEWVEFVDGHDLRILAYCPHGTQDYYVEVE